MFVLIAVPAFAQTPGVDENDCKPSPLLSRMTGCGVYQCEKKDFDAFDVVINKDAETKTLEGEVEHLKLVCPTTTSHLQLQRNTEAALKKSGYTIVFSGKHPNSDFPVVTAQKGAQWMQVQTAQWNSSDLRTNRGAREGNGAGDVGERAGVSMRSRRAASSCLRHHVRDGPAVITRRRIVLSDVAAVLPRTPIEAAGRRPHRQRGRQGREPEAIAGACCGRGGVAHEQGIDARLSAAGEATRR